VIARGKVMLGLVPIGGFGLASSLTLIFILPPNSTIFTILIMLAAFSAGLFKIPMMSWIQAHVEGRKIGDAIAYNNLMNFVFILASAGIFGGINSLLDSRYSFLAVAILSWFMLFLISQKLSGVKSGFVNIFRKNKNG
jgi:hypothetical protein